MDEINKPLKIIGQINQRVIDLLGLSVLPGTPIFLGETNIEHMKKEHPKDFCKYFPYIKNVLSSPDYVALHPTNGSIQYIKIFDRHVVVAVRVSGKGSFFARTIFEMNPGKVEQYRKRNALKKY
jgi:hypothetical protein